MSESGTVTAAIEDGVGSVVFQHPKKNSLPGSLLGELARVIAEMGRDSGVGVVTLSSRGAGPFCAGASFEEMLAIEDVDAGQDYFMGFARVVLAMKECPKFVLTRVQGKVVGGGVGLIAASDYVLAVEGAALKLAEFALGFGPFVIGPVVERKVGPAAFSSAAIDTRWRDASWAATHGLYDRVYGDSEEMDREFRSLAQRLARSSPEATEALKTIFWEGTDHWDELLASRARTSGRLILSEFTSQAIRNFKKG